MFVDLFRLWTTFLWVLAHDCVTRFISNLCLHVKITNSRLEVRNILVLCSTYAYKFFLHTWNSLRWCPTLRNWLTTSLQQRRIQRHAAASFVPLYQCLIEKRRKFSFNIFLSPPLCSITITKSITLQCIYGYYKTFIIMRLPAPTTGPQPDTGAPSRETRERKPPDFPRFSTRPAVFRGRELGNAAHLVCVSASSCSVGFLTNVPEVLVLAKTTGRMSKLVYVTY